MEKEIVHSELIKKKERLAAIGAILKARFIGLDEVIDEIIRLMLPWYIFPETQQRPTVINLWGLTGSGKTALIEALVAALDYKSLYTHMDMGEFESGSSIWLRDVFTDNLSYFDGKPAIICMDEFQFAKTIDGDKKELGRDKLRVIWELLDSGKVNYINGTYQLYKADRCLARVEKAMAGGLELQDGVVKGDLEFFFVLFGDFSFGYYNPSNSVMGAGYFMSNDFIDGLRELMGETITQPQLRDKVRTSSLGGLRELLIEGMKACAALRRYDLSRGLIFILGNLDEAYTMSGNMNPDISAHDFYEETTRITIANVKTALRKRFRNEQIARLGNNHIIYKSFNNAHFQELIRRELNRVAKFVQETFRWIVSFDASVEAVVYAEGVFPSQGTRPVFTTVKNLIESRISSVAMVILEKQLDVAIIHWRYEQERFYFEMVNANQQVLYVLEDEVNLKTESLRKPGNKNVQAHTAVHEAGHAVLAALTLRIVPTVVVSKTASGDCEGFCMVNFPEGPLTKDTIRKDIIISLGGYVAERLIFGEENTSSGVRHDIETATELANRAIRKYAMGMDPILISVESSSAEDHFYHQEKHTQEAMRIIKTGLQQAEEILKRNKLLLLKMSDYLTTHARMEGEMITSFVQQYSTEDWVLLEGFVKKDEYFHFYEDVQNQIQALEKSGVHRYKPEAVTV